MVRQISPGLTDSESMRSNTSNMHSFNDWLDHMRSTTGKSLFTVGEFWSYDKQKLHDYITATGGRMSLFDAPLHMNFHQASVSGGGYNMAGLMDNTLMKEQPGLAVTLVENHDTQPCQALESPVQDWFKPMAYAFILLREQGYPNVFHADYYGASYTTSDNNCNNSSITIASHKASIDKLLDARKKYAYGQQIDYLDHHDVIGWTRLGDSSHPQAMAVIMTDAGAGSKWMNVNRANKTFVDVTGHRSDSVTTNGDGWGNFPVNGGSYSVWVEQTGNGGGNNGGGNNSGNVDVTFSCQNGTTYWGQSVYVVGNTSELGSWNAANAVKLDATGYPTWTGSITLGANQAIEWKCIKKEGSNVQWQSGANNTYTTPSGGSGSTSGSF